MPTTKGEGPGKKRFKACPIGCFHLDVEPRGSPGIAAVRTKAGKLHLFVALDRTSTLAFAQLHETATRQVAADFLHALVAAANAVRFGVAVPYTIHTLAEPEDCSAEDAQTSWIVRQQARTGRVHAFGHACKKHGIEHRLTRPYHPWTNGQVKRMNRTLKDATVRRYHYASHDELRAHVLRAHVQIFLDAYNHAVSCSNRHHALVPRVGVVRLPS